MKRLHFALTTTVLLLIGFTLSAQEGMVKDEAGNAYATVKIGEQVWMSANLNSESAACEGANEISFANGSSNSIGSTLQDGKPHFAYYQNRPELEFGALYNINVVMQCNVCPAGYRIPTKTEWEALAEHLGGVEKAGTALKKGGSSGFNAEMMGRIGQKGSVLEGKATSWWALSDDRSAAYTVELSADGKLTLYEEGNEKWGNYVRCVKE